FVKSQPALGVAGQRLGNRPQSLRPSEGAEAEFGAQPVSRILRMAEIDLEQRLAARVGGDEDAVVGASRQRAQGGKRRQPRLGEERVDPRTKGLFLEIG